MSWWNYIQWLLQMGHPAGVLITGTLLFVVIGFPILLAVGVLAYIFRDR